MSLWESKQNRQRRLERQSRDMAGQVQRGWAKKNPVKNGIMTCLAVLLLLGVAGCVVAGLMGWLDSLG